MKQKFECKKCGREWEDSYCDDCSEANMICWETEEDE